MLPRISIVIPNWNGMEHLPDCFASLAAADYPADRQEWVVSDNGSADGSVEFLRRAYPQTRIVQNGRNIGFAPGCNAGAAAASGEFVVFLNNDTLVDPGWLHGYLDALARDPEAVCAASYMRSWDDQEVDFDGAACNLFGAGRQRPVTGWPDRPAPLAAGDPVLFACGGAMIVRRDVFLAVGGFDPSYFIYFEDVDLGWRLWVLGYRVVFAPEAKVLHKEGGTTGAARAPSHRRYLLFESNTLATIIKNYDQANLDRILPAALLLEWKRALMSAGDAIDPRTYRLGTPAPAGGLDVHGRAALPPISAAHVLSLTRLGAHLPGIMAERARIQAARRRGDAEILPLFGRPFAPQFAGPAYADAMRRLAAALDLYPTGAVAAPSRILLVSPAAGADRVRADALQAALAADFLTLHSSDAAPLQAATADAAIVVGSAWPAAAALDPAVPLLADVGAWLPDTAPAAARAAFARHAAALVCPTDAVAGAWRAAVPALPALVQPPGAPPSAGLRRYCRYPLHHGLT
ncbi:MAG TPA: glycosyltransferase family 2 protein [Chloroflexia bacterium]|nr:glycosyltransferase family 2 protein [Chloroflexia bacterium]